MTDDKTYFIAPVTTDLQRTVLGIDDAVAYASIDCRSFVAQDGTTVRVDKFDFDDFQIRLNDVAPRAGAGSAYFRLEFGDTPINEVVRAMVEGAFTNAAKDAGFKNGKPVVNFNQDPDWQWRPLHLVPATAEPEEPNLGDDAISVFPARTALGQYLVNHHKNRIGHGHEINYLIIKQEMLPHDVETALTDSEKASLRAIFKKVSIKEPSTVRVVVHFERVRNYEEAQRLPQSHEQSPFQLELVRVIKTLGFEKVIVDLVYGGLSIVGFVYD
ncbi:MAG: hypothetical protein R3E01_15410 [Pirellulaceae bacterium]